jgi:aminoglycoside phosphotransferase (APT) family kinase protein
VAAFDVAAVPPSDVAVTPELARGLLAEQHPDLADLPISLGESGWDNVVLRLGEDLALRLPRRAVASWLAMTEQTWLPVIATALPLPVPTPVRLGVAGRDYPFVWSVVPWFEGAPADIAPPGGDQGETLAAFLRALHRAAPEAAPRNPFRGSVTLADRTSTFENRAALIEAREGPLPAFVRQLWAEALAAPVDAPRSWFHGDLHGRNVLVKDGRLAAVIDWGDMAAGDAACDLAAVWMLLPDLSARRRALVAYAASETTDLRARGWALLMGLMLLAIADSPRMPAMGRTILRRLQEGP